VVLNSENLNTEKLIYEFNSLFLNEDVGIGEIARQCSVTCGLKEYNIRSICWRFFLGIISGDPVNWIDQLKKSRTLYEERKRSIIITPEFSQTYVKSSEDPNFLLIENPLSNNPVSNWYNYQANRMVENILGYKLFFNTFIFLFFFNFR
jgi:hypothetical protein